MDADDGIERTPLGRQRAEAKPELFADATKSSFDAYLQLLRGTAPNDIRWVNA
ncbi:MAG TPA: hypothetical protein VN577_04955 [Terriglobales bacterium]|nr:hypothetical protein [Terriglobales bacterium]